MGSEDRHVRRPEELGVSRADLAEVGEKFATSKAVSSRESTWDKRIWPESGKHVESKKS